MALFSSFFAVVSMVFHLTHLPFSSFSGMYHLALARVETVVCGPSTLSPYLEFVCTSLDAFKPSAPPSVIYDFDTSAANALPGLLGVSVLDLSTCSGCPTLVNGTDTESTVKPEVVYLGPYVYFGPQYSRELIVAPNCNLLAPPPVPTGIQVVAAPALVVPLDNATTAPSMTGAQDEQRRGSSWYTRPDLFKCIIDRLIRWTIEGLIYYGIWRIMDRSAQLYRRRLGLPSTSSGHRKTSATPTRERRGSRVT